MDSPQTEEQDPRIGMLLQERYRIVRKLGEGGMGAVYEANHELIGRRMAVKCLHAQFAADPQLIVRFQREAQASTMVGSEHIIEVTDMGRFPDGAPFMVMEFLDGQDVSRVLEKTGALPISRVVHIMTQVCQALSAAHAKGIVHRDLKPENVYLVTRKGDSDFVKVLDFGISKMKEQADHLSSGLTKTGTALGTPYYMAPEQAQGLKDVDHRTDIYALGIILFQMLTGHLPYDADTYPMLMVMIMTAAPPLPRSFRPDLPAELEAIVLRAIAKNRDERFQSVDELAAAIHPFRHIDAAPTVAEPPPRSALQPSSSGTTGLAWTQGTAPEPGAEPPVRSKAPIIAGVAVLGFLVIAGVGIALGVTGAFGGEPARTPPVVVAPPVMPPPARPTPPPPPAAIPPPVPAEVEITISATPSDARVFFGESEYPNGVPFNVPRSLVPVRVRVERRGYRTIEQTTLFDRPRALTFEMRRGRGVQAIEDDSSAAPPERRVERTASPPETPPETTPPNRPPPPTLTKLPSRDWE